MDDLTSPTSESTALVPAVGGDTSPTGTSASTMGAGQAAQTAFDQAGGTAIDPLDATLAAIPETDDDLSAITDEAQRTTLTGMRGHMRVLQNAIRDLRPLSIFKEFGKPEAVKPRLELARLLYSPRLGPDGRTPLRDPATQTTYVTTKPFVEYLDRVSPGMPEQLYVDLNYFRPLSEDGVNRDEELWKQHFRYLKLDPARLSEYQTIDARSALTSGAITPEELARIPAERHAAYRSIPPSIRNAWESYDEADQTLMLDQYQRSIDAAAREQKAVEDSKASEAARAQRYADAVQTRQLAYFATIRQERFSELYQSLEQQVTFSTDPIANSTMLGALCTTLATLIDPAWRFIAAEKVLTPLGIKLDSSFDTVREDFESNAADAVATEMAGDRGRAGDFHTKALHSLDQLMAKIAPIALKIAKQQGATVVEKAVAQASALAAATAGRPTAGSGTAPNAQIGILPPGMIPGSPEATRYVAEKTGFWQARPAA